MRLRAGGHLTVFRVAVETETTSENLPHWLGLDEDDPGFQLLAGEQIAAVFPLCIFFSITHN
jgi:hypothetical protein